MLVKIVAMGFSQALWKEVFQELRNRLPEQPFAVAVFCEPEEITFLEREFFPGQWKREGPDFLLCEGRAEGQPIPGHEFLKRVGALKGGPRPAMALAFASLDKGLRHLMAMAPPLSLTLENGAALSISDPAFLLGEFPRKFPRIRVNDHLTTVRLRQAEGGPGEVRVQDLPFGSLVGFSEIEAMIHQGQTSRPREWLKAVARAEGIRRAPKAAGLIRESKGVFLFPGFPLDRVRGVVAGEFGFQHLIDLSRMGRPSAQFDGLVEAVRQCGLRQAAGQQAFTSRIHQAEARADIPVVCGGGIALLRESMAALLSRRGFQRCFTLDRPTEGVFREPSLLIQVAAWPEGSLGPQADEPQLLDIGEELERRMKPLDRLLPWRELPYRPPPVEIPPLTRTAFAQQSRRLATRGGKAEKGRALEEKKVVLLEQEAGVVRAAKEKLANLLDAGDTLRVWSGRLPAETGKVLLLSHDAEEAGAVLQSLPHIAKKRWFDLAPYRDADSIQNLTLDELGHYRDGGAILITAASRERLEKVAEKIEAAVPETEQALAASRAGLEKLRVESGLVAEAKEALARHWVWEILGGWLEKNREKLDLALEVVRERHERRWLNRSLVHRALIVPFKRENGEPLLQACGEVFPAFNANLSMVVPYEFDFLDELPAREATALRQEAHQEGLSPGGVARREADALASHNEALFADYLQVISSELTGARMDLILVDHRPEIASRILAHLRNALPRLEKVPAILLLSDFWAPEPDQALPWPRTRVSLLRRMGTLSAVDAARHLRDLFPM